MTVRSTPLSRTAGAVARSIVAVCALVSAIGAIGSPAALAVEAASTTAASVPHSALAASHVTVKPGMSLAGVALAVTQSHDEAVLARAAKTIFEANPSAFMRGDPSLMKFGAELNVPPLDASGELAPAARVVAAAAPSRAASAAPAVASAPAMHAKSPGAGEVASDTVTSTVTHAASPAAAASSAYPAAQAPASAATTAIGVTTATNATTASVTGGTSGTAQSVPRSPASGVAASAVQPPEGASEHGWAGAIQSSASGPVQAAASDASGAGAASDASGAAAASGVTVTAGPTGGAKASTEPVSSASAASAPHARVSSLQQLLALKNRVLMDLQRHGFGSQSRSNAVEHAPNAASADAIAAKQAPGSALHAGVPPAQAHAPAADYFVGVGGYGIRLSHTAIAVVAAITAALLVLIAGFAISGRKQRAARMAVEQEAAASDAAAAKQQEQARRVAPLAAADADRDPVEAEFLAVLAHTPQSKRALMGLAGHYAERHNVSGFDEIAQQIWHLSAGRGPNWLHIASLGRELDPDNPLYASPMEGEEAASTMSGDAVDGTPPDHSAAAQAAQAAQAPRQDAESDAQAAAKEGAPVADEGQALPGAGALPATLVDEAPEPLSERAVEPPAAFEVRPQVEPEVAHGGAPPDGHGESATAADASDSESSHASFPADAVNALNDLDMTLPPRVDGPPHRDEHAAESDAAQAARQEAPHEAGPEDAPSAAAPVAVAGLGAARFGALNLAFDLDLPGAENGAPAMAATPEQPTFSPEETAKIARNKLELAAEYIALGDVGGARTLIHEVIESNDPLTRDEAHALLATLT
jgi:pilus assembly protein FimV